MTGTAVKNAPAILANVAPNAGKSAKGTAASGNFDFQSVWNNQVGKNEQNAVKAQKSVPDPQKPGQPAVNRGDAGPEEAQETVEELKAPAENGQPAKTDKAAQEPPKQNDGLSPEELEAAMEVLSAAAAELMQRVADTFGISMEELQGTLEELGLEPLDLLQQAGLGELVLKLGGGSDPLALLTDETLCDNYKALMEQMTEVLNETAEELKTDPKQLETLLSGRHEQAVFEGKAAGQEMIPEGEAPVEQALEKAAGEEVPDKMAFDGNISEGEVPWEKAPGRLRESEPQEKGEETFATPAEERSRVQGAANEPGAAEDRKSGEKQSGKESDGGQQGNLFAQEFKPLQPEAGVQQTQGAVQSASWSADTQDIMRQIMDYMKLQLNADTTNLELQLHPANLGTLHIQVEAKAGVITANFITQNEAVKAALESQIVQLRESFEEQGVKVEAIEVTVQSHAFERNLDQGREQEQGSHEPSRRARVRRINLNDLSAMEDMEEEDALAADMLAAGGSTVDYTA